MVYILKTEINENLNILSGMSEVYGIGIKRAKLVCQILGINKATRLKNLNTKLRTRLVQTIEKEFLINDELKKEILKKKETLVRIKTYRGIRERVNLPRRGQRTHTNAKTVKRLR